MNEEVFFTIDGKEYCDEELALSILLRESILFSNSRDYSTDFQKQGKEGHTVVLFVNANDCFVPAADAEDLDLSEVPTLYKKYEENKDFGVLIWLMDKRQQQPRPQFIKMLKESNLWTPEMDKLKPGFGY